MRAELFPDARDLILSVFLLACCLSSASARTFYLSPSGDDSATPEQGAVFRTLRAVIPHLWGGDTLIIRRGQYSGGVHIRRGCSPDAPLVIKGESKYAIIRGSGDQRDGISLDDCAKVSLDGLNVTMASRGGIVLDHSLSMASTILIVGTISSFAATLSTTTPAAAFMLTETPNTAGTG